jgi:hypothetical protein
VIERNLDARSKLMVEHPAASVRAELFLAAALVLVVVSYGAHLAIG